MTRLEEKNGNPMAARAAESPAESPRERALREEVESLRRRLAEAEDTKSAIRQSLDETLDIRHVASEILASPDAVTAARKLVDLARTVISFDWAGVFLYDETLNEFLPVDDEATPPDLRETVRFQTHQGIIDWVIEEGRPVVIPDIAGDEDEGAGGERHIVVVPLIAGDRGIGVLEACSRAPRDGYNSHQMELVSILASQAAVVMDNARLREGMAARIREMSSLFEIGRTLTSALATEDLLGFIVNEVVENTRSSFGYIHLVDRATGELVPRISRGRLGGRVMDSRPSLAATKMAERVIETRHAIMVPDVTEDARFAAALSGDDTGAKALLGSPMTDNGSVIGVITLEKGGGDGAFAASDLDLLSSFARQAAVAARMSHLQSQRAEAERRLRESQAELLRANKLASIGLLAAGVAHEINNPLQVILGLTQLLRRQDQVLPKWQENLKIMERETIRVADIVSQLLKSSRRLGHKGGIEDVDINLLLQECMRLMGHQLELRRVSVVLEGDPRLPPVPGNIGELEQVFLNMMTNAEQAMPDGGKLEIRTRTAGAYAEILFADSGVGIPAELLNNIFDPFFTTKPVGKSTGLGLFICHNVIEKHGGAIHVTSVENQGTTFTIRLPLKSKPAL